MKLIRLLIPFSIIAGPIFAVFMILVGPALIPFVGMSFPAVSATAASLMIGLIYLLHNRQLNTVMDLAVAHLTPQIDPADFRQLIDDFCYEVAEKLGSDPRDYKLRFSLRIRLTDKWVPFGGPIKARVTVEEGTRDDLKVSLRAQKLRAKLQDQLDAFLEAGGTQAIALAYLTDEEGDMVSRYFRATDYLNPTARTPSGKSFSSEAKDTVAAQ